MSYTPVELRHVHVGRSLFGYNRAMVEQVIAEVAESFEATWRERGELADQVEALEKEVAELRRREELLTHTLVAAEQAASDIRDRAKREAEAVVSEAQNEARAITRGAHAERDRLQTETKRIEAMLRAALELLADRSATPAEASVRPAAQSVEAAYRALPDAPAATEPVAVEPPAPEPPATTEGATAVAPPAAEQPAAQSAEQPVEELPVLPWPREDTREFEPVRLPPVVDETEQLVDSEPEPALPKVAGRESRDFDWGE